MKILFNRIETIELQNLFSIHYFTIRFLRTSIACITQHQMNEYTLIHTLYIWKKNAIFMTNNQFSIEIKHFRETSLHRHVTVK